MLPNSQQTAVNAQTTGRLSVAANSARRICSCRQHQQGFTLTELITVMVIIGIVGAVAVPRFFDLNTFQSRGFYDQVVSSLRFAQKTAVAQHRTVCVAFTANSLTLTIDTTIPRDFICDAPLLDSTGNPYVVNAPGGVTLSGFTDFPFTALGNASVVPATQTISVSGQATAITVETETGYVH